MNWILLPCPGCVYPLCWGMQGCWVLPWVLPWVGAAPSTTNTKPGGCFPAAASSDFHDNQQADYSITAFLLKSDIKPRGQHILGFPWCWIFKALSYV